MNRDANPGESGFLSSRNSAFTVVQLTLVAYGGIYFASISLIVLNEPPTETCILHRNQFKKLDFKKLSRPEIKSIFLKTNS